MSMFIQFNLSTYSNSCSVRLPVSTSSHGSYIVASVISYYPCMQQGVDRHPCLVTIYSLFTDTGQEVLATTVSTHNRHQLSHQLSVVTASTAASQWYTMYYEIVINITCNMIALFSLYSTSCTYLVHHVYMLFIMLILSSLSS